MQTTWYPGFREEHMTKLLRLRKTVAIATLFFLLIPGVSVPAKTRETEAARHAIVASQHPIASRIGAEIMRKGGNAVDAAIAVGLALAVVYPEAGNIGGGGFMLLRLKNGRTAAIDYREKAPKAATRDIFVDANGGLIEGEGGSVIGYRAAGVPGTVAGFELAYRKYGSGKLKWSELVEPARKIADEGFELSHRLARLFRSYASSLEKYEDSKRIFLNNGDLYEAGDRLVQKDLARTLARIRDGGAREFYKGETARLIAADMERNNGLMTLDDLAGYEAVERTPLTGTYRGHKIISMPPPSSGGIVLIQVLNMLEKYDLGSLGHNSAARYHLLIEAMRRAFADRAELMGDPDFSDVPTAKMIEKQYAARRAESIAADKASKSSDIGAGLPTGAESMDTTSYAVIDEDGNMVSNVYTINNLYGNAVTAKDTGILLNDEMDDFAARPGKPNMFGLIQGERNAVGPGKRPLSSMTPVIVLREDGSTWFATGGRGGPRIISGAIQVVLNMIDHKMEIGDAIDAPRVHHQWMPDVIYYEPYGLSPDTTKILTSYGHMFNDAPTALASMTGVSIGKDGTRYGAVDRRSDGEVNGY